MIDESLPSKTSAVSLFFFCGYVIPVLITDLTSVLREEQLKAASD
jgi:hypothetical protein